MIASVTHQEPVQERHARIIRVLARLRHRQLQLAKQGRYVESGHCAARADRIRMWLLTEADALQRDDDCPCGEKYLATVDC